MDKYCTYDSKIVKPEDLKADIIDGENNDEEPLLAIMDNKETHHAEGQVSTNVEKVFSMESNSDLMMILGCC